MRIALIVLALLAPTSAAAQPASDFCSDLKRVVVSASEGTPFGSVSGAQGRGVWTPPGLIGCQIFTLSGDTYQCRVEGITEPVATESLRELHQNIGRCLGVQGVQPGLFSLLGIGHLAYTTPMATVEVYRKNTAGQHSVHLMITRKG